MYAALRAIPIPDDVVARLFHAASLLREHRGDGHIAALMVEGVGGLEAHVLLALDESLTDHLATKPYESLEPGELDELMQTLEPLATLLVAAQD